MHNRHVRFTSEGGNDRRHWNVRFVPIADKWLKGAAPTGETRRFKSLQAISDLGDSGISTGFVFLTAGGAGNANRTDHLGAGLDRYAAADRNDVRDLR